MASTDYAIGGRTQRSVRCTPTSYKPLSGFLGAAAPKQGYGGVPHISFPPISPGRVESQGTHDRSRRSNQMQQWAYKVVYIDNRGRISSEGLETLIGNERRSTFARRYLNSLGRDGWELVGIQLLTSNSAYYVFKRPAQEGDFAEEAPPAASEGTASGGPTVET